MPDQVQPGLGLAVKGFVDLAEWFTKLVGDQALATARALEARPTPSDPRPTASGELARLGALWLLGSVGLVNEIFDAAAVLARPPREHRDIDGDHWFPVPADLPPGPITAEVVAPLRRDVTGPGETLTSVAVEVDHERRVFKLVARSVPTEQVGVFRGQVAVRVAGSGAPPRVVDVWLVVP